MLSLYAGNCPSNQSHEILANISAKDEKINRIYYSSDKLLSFNKLKSPPPCHPEIELSPPELLLPVVCRGIGSATVPDTLARFHTGHQGEAWLQSDLSW